MERDKTKLILKLLKKWKKEIKPDDNPVGYFRGFHDGERNIINTLISFIEML